MKVLMLNQQVTKWCLALDVGRRNVENENPGRSGRSSVVVY